MDQCIDLYSRLIIATITFVGPFIILLLSNFTSGEKRRKDLTKNSVEEIANKAKNELKNGGSNFTDTIHKSSEEIKKIEKNNAAELSRLNPIKQFWFIYGCLGSSYLFLNFVYLIRENYLNMYNHILSISIIATSILFYLISIFFIIRTFYTIIKTRKIIDS